jgi:hypothetical protein
MPFDMLDVPPSRVATTKKVYCVGGSQDVSVTGAVVHDVEFGGSRTSIHWPSNVPES